MIAASLVGVALVAPTSAQAITPVFTWSGDSAEANWSAAKNWSSESIPSSSEKVALVFPRIPSCSGTCYESNDNLTGIQAESLSIDDGDGYILGGNEIDLGGGGLTASPSAGSSGPAGDFLALPMHLTASQTWNVSGRSGGGIGENGVDVIGSVSGEATSLNIGIGNEAAVYLENETEAGSVTVEGDEAGKAGVLNGFVGLYGEVNYSNGNPVDLNHIFLVGSGALGALQTNAGELDVGSGLYPAEGILADSADFDSSSEAQFQVVGEGVSAGNDYSQLASIGAIELGGAKLRVHVTPPSPSSSICPRLPLGQTYTFVYTTGTLSGVFSNALEGGPEIPISFAARCGSHSQTMRIAYHRGGGISTVTGTVEARAKEEQESHEREEEQKGREQLEARERQEARERREHEEAIAKAAELTAQKAAEENARRSEQERATTRQQEEIAAVAKREEEEAGMLGPGHVTLVGSVLKVHGRIALVKLSCRGLGPCEGKLHLIKRGKRQIGVASFSISFHETVVVKIRITAFGIASLRSAHHRLGASLTIASSSGRSHRQFVRLE